MMLPVLRRLERQLDPFAHRPRWVNIDRFVDDFMSGDNVNFANNFGSMDVYEQENRLNVVVELPGCKREDIDITLENGVLNLAAARKEESENKDDTYYVRERSYGQWSRSIRLPVDVDADQIEATYQDGVLKIEIEKAEKAKTHKIKVR